MINFIKRALAEARKKREYKKELVSRIATKTALQAKLKEYAKPSICRKEFSHHKIYQMQRHIRQIEHDILKLKELLK